MQRTICLQGHINGFLVKGKSIIAKQLKFEILAKATKAARNGKHSSKAETRLYLWDKFHFL